MRARAGDSADWVPAADDGFWVLLAFVPYLVAYFGFRGAIASAHSLGQRVGKMPGWTTRASGCGIFEPEWHRASPYR